MPARRRAVLRARRGRRADVRRPSAAASVSRRSCGWPAAVSRSPCSGAAVHSRTRSAGLRVRGSWLARESSCWAAVAAPVVARSLCLGAARGPAAWAAFVAAGSSLVGPSVRTWCASRVGAVRRRSLAALVLAFDAWPHDALREAWTALRDAPAVRAPFDPGRHPSLHGLVALAAFGLALAASLAVAADRMPIAAAAVAVGVGCPPGCSRTTRDRCSAASRSAAVLWVVRSSLARAATAAPRRRARRDRRRCGGRGGCRRGVAPGDARVDWRGWDPFADSSRTADVALRLGRALRRASSSPRGRPSCSGCGPRSGREYWRVSTLELFAGDRWIEDLYPVRCRRGRAAGCPPTRSSRAGTRDPAMASADGDGRGLEDDQRSRPPASPHASTASRSARLSYLGGGVMRARAHRCAAGRGTRSGATRRARRRARSRRRRPAVPARDRPVPRARPRASCRASASGSGARGRPAVHGRALPARSGRTGRSGTRRGAAPRGRARRTRRRSLLERWFRARRRLPLRGAAAGRAPGPPLVDFVEVTRAGYCQHFAGAMALMLRMLGDPGAGRGRLHERAPGRAGAGRSPTSRRTPGWRRGSPATAGSPSTRRRAAGRSRPSTRLRRTRPTRSRALGTGRFLDFNRDRRRDGAAGDARRAVAPTEDGAMPWWLALLVLLA